MRPICSPCFLSKLSLAIDFILRRIEMFSELRSPTMVTFVRNRKLSASALAAINQGENHPIRANGHRACVQKSTVVYSKDQRKIQKNSCFHGPARNLQCLKFMLSLPSRRGYCCPSTLAPLLLRSIRPDISAKTPSERSTEWWWRKRGTASRRNPFAGLPAHFSE